LDLVGRRAPRDQASFSLFLRAPTSTCRAPTARAAPGSRPTLPA
jgi:hypothetical protein